MSKKGLSRGIKAGIVIVTIIFLFLLTLMILLPAYEDVREVRVALKELRNEVRQLQQENLTLQRELEALRDDPILAERRARERGLAMPGEIIYDFKEPHRH